MTRKRPLALFGLETRYVTRLYLSKFAVVACFIMALVLVIDLSGHLDRVIAAGQRQGQTYRAPLVWSYLLLRAGYNLPAILPIALVVGVIWVEFYLARSRQRAMIANTGRERGLSLMPAVIVGVIVGLLQVVALAEIRPQSVKGQGEAGYRYYGPKFQGGVSGYQWIALDGAFLKTRVDFGGEIPALVSLKFFKLNEQNELTLAAWAPSAKIDEGGVVLEGQRSIWPSAAVLEDKIPLHLNRVWLEQTDVEPGLILQEKLEHIVAAEYGVPNQDRYRAALEERRAGVVSLLSLAVVTAYLCLSLFRPKVGLAPALTIAAVGYALHVGRNVLATMGEFERLDPHVSAWGLPMTVLAITALLQIYSSWMVRKQLKRF